jgi:acyl-CoA synthetase (AMP-forming)/AMP-acid ligase II
MTETGAPVTRTVPDDWAGAGGAADVLASAGRATHISQVAILGPQGQPVDVGQDGEIAVRSETLFEGYYQAPEQTAEALVDGWLHTGDVGHLDDAGYLYVTDRLKDMIVSGRMNVFPAEVERSLWQMPGVASAAVIGVPHPRWGETVVAAVVRRDRSLTEEAVIAWVGERLAAYKKPAQVKFVAELPLTSNQKVDKRRLRDTWLASA